MWPVGSIRGELRISPAPIFQPGCTFVCVGIASPAPRSAADGPGRSNGPVENRSWSKRVDAERTNGGYVIIGTDTATIASDTDIAGLIETSLSNDKAIDPITIDLTGKTSLADTMVIATGSSRRHIEAMAEHMLERLKARGLVGTIAEGRGQSDWVLIDAGDVIVHLFRDETRRFYDLERLWGDPAPEKDKKIVASANG